MRLSRLLLSGLLALAATEPALAQQDYANSTTPSGTWAGGSWIGLGNVVGQSFAASGSTLNSFGFYASSAWTGNGTFQAMLFAYNGAGVSGSPLYSSSVLNYSSITTGWFDFFTGGVGLTAGNMYMALIAPVWVSSGTSLMNLGVESGDPYSGAGYYSTQTLPTTTASLQGASWYPVGGSLAPGRDLALRLDYEAELVTQSLPGGEVPIDPLIPTTTTPEPASMVLVATGLVSLMGAGRVRRKRRG